MISSNSTWEGGESHVCSVISDKINVINGANTLCDSYMTKGSGFGQQYERVLPP